MNPLSDTADRSVRLAVTMAYCDARSLFRAHSSDGLGALIYRAIQKPKRGFLALDGTAPEERGAELRCVCAVGVSNNAPIPSLLALSDPKNPAGQALHKVGIAVEGELDVACEAGGVYGR